LSELFGINHLVENEKKAIIKTEEKFGRLLDWVPDLIDLLLQLRYFSGVSDGKGESGDVHWFCATH
jgi:hypothetical protein